MNLWMLSPEMTPFSKVGGLGDVVGALPGALAPHGYDTTVFIPWLPSMEACPWTITDTGVEVEVESAGAVVTAKILETKLPGGAGRVLFIQCPLYFDREGLYGTADGEYWDNAVRFSFFTRAALEAGRKIVPGPDVVHSHDWPAALAPLMVRGPEHYGSLPEFLKTVTVQSLHNLAHQGRFPKEMLPELGLSWHRFNHLELEFWDTINFLKAGIVFSDAIIAVSPTYAREIQHPENGWGLDGVLRERVGKLHGIINGIDTDLFNPATDSALAGRFSVSNLKKRTANAAKLREYFNLPETGAPLVGMVGRFVHQKGLDILLDLAPRLKHLNLQWAILGSGDRRIENALTDLAAANPSTMGVEVGFSEDLARLIYGGTDFFFMPSLFEPCGLSQMIALRYGSVPIVRRTGGLNDTVTDFGIDGGVGVVFDHPNADDANHALWRAAELRKDEKEFKKVRKLGMKVDFSWENSAKKYDELYRSLTGRRQVAATPRGETSAPKA